MSKVQRVEGISKKRNEEEKKRFALSTYPKKKMSCKFQLIRRRERK
jgi:hypothetical protein